MKFIKLAKDDSNDLGRNLLPALAAPVAIYAINKYFKNKKR